MIVGIPYFGENNNEITKDILDYNYSRYEEYDSLYGFINSNIKNRIIVVIGDRLTWLNDIVFNYRDKECYLPYYDYKISKCLYRTCNKGHLIKKDKDIYFRYEYQLKRFDIDLNINSVVLKCYNVDTSDGFYVKLNKWVGDEEEFNIDKIYKLYVESAYTEDDFLINKHAGGYHYIMRSPDNKFKNVERKLREEYELNDYSPEHKIERDYRDVRNYKYSEVLVKYGLIDNIELYRERRLRFESYLYCCARAGKLNSIKFTHGIYKYGEYGIKLIIKDYWVYDKQRPNKTWVR